jgi:hypothetical protein
MIEKINTKLTVKMGQGKTPKHLSSWIFAFFLVFDATGLLT